MTTEPRDKSIFQAELGTARLTWFLELLVVKSPTVLNIRDWGIPEATLSGTYPLCPGEQVNGRRVENTVNEEELCLIALERT